MKNHLPLVLALLLSSSTAFSLVPDQIDATASSPPVSPPVAQFLKLVQGDVPDDVVLSYIQNFPGTFDLTPEEVIQLENDGVNSEFIKAMFLHDHDWRLQSNASYNTPTGLPAFESPPMSPDQTQSSQDQPTEPVPDMSQETTDMPPQELPPDQSAMQPYDMGNSDAASFFYGSLAPYGSWCNTPGSGWCWQPSECQDKNWKPYCDKGQWCFTDCGWYWNSYYKWGWAPFHYGRWSNDPKKGWLWFPDKQWGPSWVTWRDCGKGIGWAPLPPKCAVLPSGIFFNKNLVPPGFGFSLKPRDFVFVDPKDIAAIDLRPAAFGPVQSARIFAQTSVVNNWSTDPKGDPMNLGLDVNLVAGDSKKPILRAHIKDAGNQQSAGFTPGSPGSPGTFGIYRPQVDPTTDPAGTQPTAGQTKLPFATESRPGAGLHAQQNPNPDPTLSQNPGSTSQPQNQPFRFSHESPKVLSQQNPAYSSQPNPTTIAPSVAPTPIQFPQTIRLPQGSVAVPSVPTQHFNVGVPARGNHG